MDRDAGTAIDMLNALLEDEAVGRAFDPVQAIALAREVARTVPELPTYMSRIISRMRARQARNVAA